MSFHLKIWIWIVILGVCLGGGAFSQSLPDIHVDNISPRLDQDGKVVDAHDGRVIKFGDHYYWYGTQYQGTNGFQKSNSYVCYKSRDLGSWVSVGPLFEESPEGVYYRPHVVFNAQTQKYVLWYNWYPKLWEGKFGVAYSDKPEGPFRIVDPDVKVKYSDIGVGDFGLFIDDDQTAYLVYNTINGHKVSIEKLSKDYLGSTQQNGGIITENCEAGSMFKRKGKYYLLTDYTCCFCNEGSGARVYISDSPLNGYQFTRNINRRPGKELPSLTDNEVVSSSPENLSKRKGEFHALILDFPDAKQIAAIELSIFTGGRKGQCGEVGNPKVHDPIETPSVKLSSEEEPHTPIEFTQTLGKKALIQSLRLDFSPIESGRIFVQIDPSFPYDLLRLTEVKAWGQNGEEISLTAYKRHNSQTPIIPAQQSYVMEISGGEENVWIWMGDLWGSALDNVKGHDFQYWSQPLQFQSNGWIRPMQWTSNWTLTLEK